MKSIEKIREQKASLEEIRSIVSKEWSLLDQEIEKQFLNSQLDFIKLATPTTNITRLKCIIQKASGFLYYVSVL